MCSAQIIQVGLTNLIMYGKEYKLKNIGIFSVILLFSLTYFQVSSAYHLLRRNYTKKTAKERQTETKMKSLIVYEKHISVS
jgi:hypothetical protein